MGLGIVSKHLLIEVEREEDSDASDTRALFDT